MASILSCDSEAIIWGGVMLLSRVCTVSVSIVMPIPRVSAVSDVAQASPPPPKSLRALIYGRSSSTASITIFSMNGSGIWTAERSSSSMRSDANWAPPTPSYPVDPPSNTMWSPGPAVLCMSRSLMPKPTAATSTSVYLE